MRSRLDKQVGLLFRDVVTILQLFCKTTNQTTTTTTTNKQGSAFFFKCVESKASRSHTSKLFHKFGALEKNQFVSLVFLLQTSMNAKPTMAAVNTAV